MKNSLRNVTYIALFLIIHIASAVETQSMEFFDGDEESLTTGYINITGVDRKRLFNALLDHAIDFNQQQINEIKAEGATHLSNSIWDAACRRIPGGSFPLGSFVGTSEQPKTLSYEEAIAKFSDKSSKNFTQRLQLVPMQISISAGKLKDEQSIIFSSVDGHQLGLKFKRVCADALLPGQVYDSLYVAAYDRMYGGGEAKRIYDDLAKESKNTRFAKGLLSTLRRKSLSPDATGTRMEYKTEEDNEDEEVEIHFILPNNHENINETAESSNLLGMLLNMFSRKKDGK